MTQDTLEPQSRLATQRPADPLGRGSAIGVRKIAWERHRFARLDIAGSLDQGCFANMPLVI